MKKKFTYGLLLLSCVCLGCNFTACKDTEDDLRAEMNREDDALLKLINDLKQAQEDCKTNCNNKFNDILNKLDGKADAATLTQLKTDFDNLLDRIGPTGKTWTEEEIKNLVKAMGYLTPDDIKEITINITNINTQLEKVFGEGGLSDQVTTLTNNYDDLKNKYNTLNIGFAQLYSMIKTLEENTKLDLSELRKTVDNLAERLPVAEQNALDALEMAKTNSTKIATLDNLYNELKGNIGDMTDLTNLADEIRALKTKDGELQQQIDMHQFAINMLFTNYQQLKSDLEKLEERVKANEDAIKEINDRLDKLTELENRVNSLITSMMVQGVYNPLFGTFSLPIGVQSNMLVNYYGYSDKQTYTFPSTQQIASVDNEPQLTAEEYAVLEASGLKGEQIENGTVLLDTKDANLGRIFVTINPNNIDFSNGDLTLVNSQDAACTVKLKNLKRSDEVLTFGYSRAANNGFYQADAYLEPNLEAIEKVKVTIDPKLKSAMKEILKDGRSGLRTNALHLMKALYDQFNGFLPAYGLKAGWTVNGQDYAVYSNYNIAATTFRPLSYNFLRGESIGSKRFPIIDPISNAIISINADDYKFDFSDIKVEINASDINLNFNFTEVKLNYDGTFTVTVEDKANGITLTGEVNPDDLQKFMAELNKQFNELANTQWNKDVERAFREALEQLNGRINDAVEKALLDMQGKINDKIADMINDIQDQVNDKVGSYINKFNSFIDRYNDVAKRLNNFLDNPNYYMQPAVFYEGSNARNFLLSTNPANPTVLVNGGGDGFMIYASSFNAEVIAPAYKKVVAVTDVIDNATGKSVADAKSQCVTINGGASYLASVVPGSQKRFAIPTSGMKAGYTYEILYTAVDYQGVTATERYYVTVR